MASTWPNNDIVTEILSHLPIRSLFRFRIVCKFWRDVIDSPTFRKLHIQKQDNNNNEDDTVLVQFSFIRNRISKLSIMLLDNGKPSHAFPALTQFCNDHLKPDFFGTAYGLNLGVVGPANGLICIYHGRLNGPIAVCNPSLGQIKLLPESPKCLFPNMRGMVYTDVGIGFDNVVQGYKVVRLMSSSGQDRLHASVYSRTTNSWRELAGDAILDQELYVIKPIKSSYKNGSFAHWRAIRVVGANRETLILSFDMKNEVFRILEMPDYERLRSLGNIKIFATDDSFVLFIYSDLDNGYSRVRGPKSLMIFEARFEGNTLRWDFATKVGEFGRITPTPKALWRSDCVVLEHFSMKKRLIFYDYCVRN
ncbi:hypothetical protein C2S53_012679 [Perilla frutescens var. hirtella]|uniref:F-box domain-containing protein n=1 Tax=Perilla frutescens var. hirtella TaxID=608512 RepID=A0AAD4PC63_PERFH|nr:hypothetical protein C2S53_012679 [Perilla frutescens var. hirtella]